MMYHALRGMLRTALPQDPGNHCPPPPKKIPATGFGWGIHPLHGFAVTGRIYVPSYSLHISARLCVCVGGRCRCIPDLGLSWGSIVLLRGFFHKQPFTCASRDNYFEQISLAN